MIVTWSWGRGMKGEWESLAVDDLFALHKQMAAVLSAKLIAEKIHSSVDCSNSISSQN